MTEDRSPAFEKLLSANLLSGRAKKRLLEQHLGFAVDCAAWQMDLTEPSVTLSCKERSAEFLVQVIGTYKKETSEWLWAWANEGSNLPPHSVMAVNAVRQLGELHQIPELTTSHLTIDPSELFQLGTALSSVLGRDADAYLSADTGGPLVVGIMLCQSGATDLSMALPQDILSILTGADLSFDKLKVATKSLLGDCGMQLSTDGAAVVGSASDGRSVKATFDDDSLSATFEAWLTRPQ